MDLQISVFLLFILFTAGTKTNNDPYFKYRSYLSAKCYECMDLTDSCVKIAVQCPVGFNKCFSSTTIIEIGNFSIETQKKKCSFGCRSGSWNFGDVKGSTSCCGTNFCNAKDPDPRKNTPNGNKCYYCDDQSCSNILSCSGTEDHCLTSTTIFNGSMGLPMVVKGCASENVCNIPTSTFITDISCCKGNLCNGDTQSVTQSSMYNHDKRVTQSFIQSFMHKSDTQSFIYNGAQSDTQSFLFLCCSLLSYVLLH